MLLFAIFAYGCSGDNVVSSDENEEISKENEDDDIFEENEDNDFEIKERPTASFVGLKAGTKVSGETTISVLANSGYEISEVSLFVDNEFVVKSIGGSATNGLYEFDVDFNQFEAGEHEVRVEVKDEERYEVIEEISVISEVDWAPTGNAKIKITIDEFLAPKDMYQFTVMVSYYVNGEKKDLVTIDENLLSDDIPFSNVYDIADDADSLKFYVKAYYYKSKDWIFSDGGWTPLDFTPDSGDYYIHSMSLLYLHLASGKKETYSYRGDVSIAYTIGLIKE